MRFFVRSFVLTAISSCLLILAFPRYDLWILAWVALVPFLTALDRQSPGRAFGWGYVLGLFFFAGTLYWIVHVTVLGLVLLVLYLSLYFGLFALTVRWLSSSPAVIKMIGIPSLWVVLEFVRSRLFTGFGWGALGYSQYLNTAMIQIADITGVAGISFLIVMVNVLVTEAAGALREGTARKFLKGPAAAGCVALLAVFVYGSLRLMAASAAVSADEATVAVIQGNIPQAMKWNDDYEDLIWDRYLTLTQNAAGGRPDLIVWPESSFPGYLWESPRRFEDLKSFTAEINVPLLVGVVRKVGPDYYNSAFLISETGDVLIEHDKLHLVPFGEYVPWRGFLPFLTDIVPIDDFTPGREFTLFPMYPQERQRRAQKFLGVLICFEDTIPHLSRQFVQAGADILVNITNDAWFGDTNEPFLHLQGSVFRAVENKRSVIRAANTGVSAFIDPFGRIDKTLKDHSGKETFVEGYASARVVLAKGDTWYTKFGEIFTYLCFGCILVIILRRLQEQKSF